MQLKLVYELERKTHLRELIQVPVLFLSSDRPELAGQLWDMSIPVAIQRKMLAAGNRPVWQTSPFSSVTEMQELKIRESALPLQKNNVQV